VTENDPNSCELDSYSSRFIDMSILQEQPSTNKRQE
jgi:hypothetical protein